MLETLYQVFEVVSVVGGLGKIFFWMQSMAQKRKKEDWRKAQTACGAVCARCAIDNNKYFFFFFKIGKSKAENQTSIMYLHDVVRYEPKSLGSQKVETPFKECVGMVLKVYINLLTNFQLKLNNLT